jgi:hypothetical protein
VDVLLHQPVGLLHSVADLLLHVGVGRVVLDQRPEVLLFIVSGLAHEHAVLEFFRLRLDLLSGQAATLTVPLGSPFLERSRRE